MKIENCFGNWILRGKNWTAGFYERGNCWVFRFHAAKYNTCTIYSFWRFYVSVDKNPKAPTNQ